LVKLLIKRQNQIQKSRTIAILNGYSNFLNPFL
jgi:hypothetical protein